MTRTKEDQDKTRRWTEAADMSFLFRLAGFCRTFRLEPLIQTGTEPEHESILREHVETVARETDGWVSLMEPLQNQHRLDVKHLSAAVGNQTWSESVSAAADEEEE